MSEKYRNFRENTPPECSREPEQPVLLSVLVVGAGDAISWVWTASCT